MYTNNFHFTVNDCQSWFKSQVKEGHHILIKLQYRAGDTAYCRNWKACRDWYIMDVQADTDADIRFAESDGSNWIVTVAKNHN